ncbi:MAG TPA: DNA-processing protein DprA [Anaerolineaceae bacterium]|nr:DNA-processing protein DprA [Anaerolineaceae bacterium]
MDPIKYWVGFNLVKGIGAVRFKQILDFFGSAATAWDSPSSGLIAAGLPQKVVDNFVAVRNQVDLDQVMDRININGIRVMTWSDSDYPRRLREIDQSPPVLFIKGSINVEDDWAVAVVGTRRVTPYGRQVASEIASYLAQNGVTVVSGLARGVDAIAHQSALRAGGRTIAVLGSGVDVIYPPEHRKLAADITSQGALVSDYPVGTSPDGVNFPPRNRIISGLSLATVVVEAGEKSGALITAEFAVEQGREVFAVPGSILAPQSEGTNQLIEQGARPLLRMSEILEGLKLEQIPQKQQARKLNPLNPVEQNLLQHLSPEPLHIDQLCEMTGLPINDVSATLTMMELKGFVSQVGGMNYVAMRETQSMYKVKK